MRKTITRKKLCHQCSSCTAVCRKKTTPINFVWVENGCASLWPKKNKRQFNWTIYTMLLLNYLYNATIELYIQCYYCLNCYELSDIIGCLTCLLYSALRKCFQEWKRPITSSLLMNQCNVQTNWCPRGQQFWLSQSSFWTDNSEMWSTETMFLQTVFTNCFYKLDFLLLHLPFSQHS